MWPQILPGLRMKLFMLLLVGIVYPLAITGICQFAFPHQANGSLVTSGASIVGSDLIGQGFSRPEYFQPRPSSAGGGYDATASSGSNLGPTSAKLLYGTTKTGDNKTQAVDFDGVSLRLVHYCLANGIPYQASVPLERFEDAQGHLDDARLIQAFRDPTTPLLFRAKGPIPADAVTGSASGLDPHISVAAALYQVPRVARQRGLSETKVLALVNRFTQGRQLGILGESRVNVLLLNQALDQMK